MSVPGATAAVIGVGGMGIRHLKALRQLGVRVVALCDRKQQALEAGSQEAPGAKAMTSVEDFLSSAAGRADLVCVVTNTPGRAKILLELCRAGARRVVTEKPFTTNLADAYAVTGAYEKAGIPLTVNTFRHFCDNHLRLRELLRSGRLGKLRHVAIQSASTGLGNMGSVFFDVMNFYLEDRPVEVTGAIDRTGTPSVRGTAFRDPGGYGMVRYENGGRGFLDTSEDTGIPYSFHLATTYGRIWIDELFNRWQIQVRNEEDKRSRPLTHYLTPLSDVPFKLTHPYDPVEMTRFTLEAALQNRPQALNAQAALTAMEMIIGMHVSDEGGRIPVPLPLDRRHHLLDIPFA